MSKTSLVFVWILGIACAWPVTASQAETMSVYAQREAYRTALDDLTAGRTKRFNEQSAQLNGYILAPYLAYYELQSRLSSATAADISSFQQNYGYLPVADIVRNRWLKRLGSRHDWTTLLANYQPTTDAELNCFRLRALAATGDKTAAYAEVPQLWMVAKSQPKACDPLFEAWIKDGNLTEGMVWRRLQLALNANARTLARYLQRFFASSAAQQAQDYYNVHVSPSNITRTSRYATDNELSRTVIQHGLMRLSRSDPQAAEKAWQSYRRSDAFSEQAVADITAAIAIGNAAEGRFPADPNAVPDSAAVGIAEAAIAQQNWPRAAYWVDRIGGEERLQRRWQYWLARSLAASVLSSERAQLTYQALASERDYYGFLAAEQIGRPVSMNHEPLQLTAVRINQLRQNPAIARAIELYAVGDQINARREWRDVLPQLNDEEQAAAAALAGSIGWTSQSIFTASAEPLRNTLELRFPLAYPDSFERIAHATNVSRSFLQAIARQESAFNPQARSSANARGLMQLMHPTATAIAKRLGVNPPTVSELYDPSVNVELAGHHLAALLDRYNQQRPLAAAAYNAGESRVTRWTKDRSGQAMDVWIETIPFRETRNYVKNVLAFDQVYSQLMNNPIPMLKVHEAAIR